MARCPGRGSLGTSQQDANPRLGFGREPVLPEPGSESHLPFAVQASPARRLTTFGAGLAHEAPALQWHDEARALGACLPAGRPSRKPELMPCVAAVRARKELGPSCGQTCPTSCKSCIGRPMGNSSPSKAPVPVLRTGALEPYSFAKRGGINCLSPKGLVPARTTSTRTALPTCTSAKIAAPNITSLANAKSPPGRQRQFMNVCRPDATFSKLCEDTRSTTALEGPVRPGSSAKQCRAAYNLKNTNKNCETPFNIPRHRTTHNGTIAGDCQTHPMIVEHMA